MMLVAAPSVPSPSHPNGGHRRRRWAVVALGLAATFVAPACQPTPPGPAVAAPAPASPTYVFERRAAPARTVVTRGGAWVATFTDGARTVTLAGPERTLAEPGVAASVTTSTWVRVLAAPFTGTVDQKWLATQAASTAPDVFAQALQYVAGAPDLLAGPLRVAGDAHYGPLDPEGKAIEGSDFNDYLGIPWTYGGKQDKPEADQVGSLDCSGYVRMLWGYRNHVPMAQDPDGSGLPRRAHQMLSGAPGVVIRANTGSQVKTFADLAPGDLVFFDAATDDGTQVDHVGIYLGIDSTGHQRFVSSRKTADGPTLGDLGGSSRLDGTGHYATAYRAARRL